MTVRFPLLLVPLAGQDVGFDGIQRAQHPVVLTADLSLQLLPLVGYHVEHVPQSCVHTERHTVTLRHIINAVV